MKVKALGILFSLVLCLSLVAVLASAYPTTVKANGGPYTWHVATIGNDTTGDGSQGNPWLTIQHAIDNAGAFDTITVHPGQYVAGNTVLQSNLTIQSSDGPEVTSVHGSAINGFTIWGKGVVIDGFTITTCSIGIRLADPQKISADDCIIKNNDIHDNVTGILVESSNNIISHNTISYNNEQPKDFSGIHLGLDATNNLIINNTIEGNDHGIGIEGHNNTIVGNNIVNNGAVTSGIHLTDDAYDNEIHLNNISGNSGYGVFSESLVLDVYAQNNWWGDVSGPSNDTCNPTGAGDAISDLVVFELWLGAPLDLPAAHYEYLGPGYHVVDASDEADTKVTLTISEEKSETGIVIAKYESQPF
ncbi:MAG: right-handed parallel beta-helix repeat-containing protein, partial [Chloroflexi bacterium]|nr:right-handed parallel beta-helix repeat-containing protein [Chloroflexota bacterium]